jgi:hypothetical protein
MNGRPAPDSKLLCQSPYGLSECGQTHISCGILTFAILFPLNVLLEEERHLGESDQKLDIPAGYVRDGKEKARQDAGHMNGGLISQRQLESAFAGDGCDYWSVLASLWLEMPGTLCPRDVLRRHRPGVIP